ERAQTPSDGSVRSIELPATGEQRAADTRSTAIEGFDIWLETRGTEGVWTRLGGMLSTTLDADHAQATLQLQH
ncbi:MAG: hypothetical protein ABI054_07480, partial [Planctomycetota bacterium]